MESYGQPIDQVASDARVFTHEDSAKLEQELESRQRRSGESVGEREHDEGHGDDDPQPSERAARTVEPAPFGAPEAGGP